MKVQHYAAMGHCQIRSGPLKMVADKTRGFLEPYMEDGCEDTELEEEVVDTDLDQITSADTDRIHILMITSSE